MSTIIQRAFSGGELSPALRTRVDIAKYQTGCATLRNFQVQRYGGASNRSGTQFVCEVKDSTRTVRLIPFVFNATQTYILEFGHLYMRVIKNGAILTDITSPIQGITQATQAVVTSSPHGFTNGKQVVLSGLNGMSELNGRTVIVSDTTDTTYKIKDLSGNYINSTAFSAYVSGGVGKRIFELDTPFVEADLSTLQYIQSADVVTITHHNYPPQKLYRVGDVYWVIEGYTFQPSILPIFTSKPTFTAGTAGAIKQQYAFTVVAVETYEESLSYKEANSNYTTSISKASPAVVTTNDPHGYTTGDHIVFQSARANSEPVGFTEIAGKSFFITVTGANTFTLDNTNTTASPSTDGGSFYSWQRDGFAYLSAAPTTTNPNKINFPTDISAFQNMREINVYKYDTNNYYFLGTFLNNGATQFLDVGLTVDKSSPIPEARNPFVGAGNYPSACAYIQQRLVLANTLLAPEKIWTSRTGSFGNFTISSPSTDDQAITFTMVGRQVNAVQYLLDVGQFLVLTTGGEWAIQGNDGIITPVGINPKQYSYNGSAEGFQPIIVGNTAFYVQARGNVIRDLGYRYESDGYTGNDLTLFSTHLFDKFVLKDWAYQQVPHSILWVTRTDGTLLGLTYVKDQQIVAWHHHDTDGSFENVSSIPEGSEDVLYTVVKRVVNGRTVRYIERLTSRKILDIRDAKFMDSSITYDGRNLSVTTMTLSGSGWTYEDQLTLTASAANFVASDVGNSVFLYLGSDQVRFRITGYTSSTVVVGYPEKSVPVSLQGVATSSWSKAVKSLRGLNHLEGKAVSVFADANVVSSPNNPGYDTLTVTNGQLTFDKAYAVVQIGLPYISDLETLNIDSSQSETLIDKQKLVTEVTISVEETRGGFIGGQMPSGTDATENLSEFKPRSFESYNDPARLHTGRIKQPIAGSWNQGGQVFIRQVDPLPMALLAVAPSGVMPFKG